MQRRLSSGQRQAYLHPKILHCGRHCGVRRGDRHPRVRDGQDSVCDTGDGLRSTRLTTSRLQLQGELQAKKDAPRLYRGVFHGVGVILKNEGPKGLLRGLNCAVRTTAPLHHAGRRNG